MAKQRGRRRGSPFRKQLLTQLQKLGFVGIHGQVQAAPLVCCRGGLGANCGLCVYCLLACAAGASQGRSRLQLILLRLKLRRHSAATILGTRPWSSGSQSLSESIEQLAEITRRIGRRHRLDLVATHREDTSHEQLFAHLDSMGFEVSLYHSKLNRPQVRLEVTATRTRSLGELADQMDCSMRHAGWFVDLEFPRDR